MSTPERGTTAPALIIYYLVQYAAIGITLPFFPQYLKSLGLSGTEVGFLMAVTPALSLVSPPFWAQIADRTGRPGRVLLLVTGVSSACFAVFLNVRGFSGVLAVLVFYACFSTACSPQIDALTLRHVARHGGSYARLRVFGSLGFAVASLIFGRMIDVIDDRVLWAALGLTAISTTWTAIALQGVRVHGSTGPRPTLAAALGLAESRDVRIFLAAVALHWIACGPFHSALSIHVTALGLPPHVVGDAATLGVFAEIVVMFTWPRWGHRLSPRTLLFVAFAASAVRWAGMALTSDGRVLIALGVFHALTYGVFFLSSVAFMAARAPETLRATGQALFVAAAFGIGGLTGYLGTGVTLDLVPDSHWMFAGAAGIEVLAALLVLRLGAHRLGDLREFDGPV